jgi:hypothetical protein
VEIGDATSRSDRPRFDLRSFGRDLGTLAPYALAAVALALSVHGIGGQSLWLDEAALADYVRSDRFMSAPPYYAAPILHMLVLRGLVYFDSELIMRLLAAVSVAAAVLLVVQAARLYGRSP